MLRALSRALSAKSMPRPLIELPYQISLESLAVKLSVPTKIVLESFREIEENVMLEPESMVARDTAEMLVHEYNWVPRWVGEEIIHPIRPPIITIMGHVDHGKTTLLDALRSSHITDGEYGGITQGIGAFSVKTPSGESLTILDTPGHAAFSQMRQRGAQVTDIVVLVVCAQEGVQPQTLEAIQHAQDAEVPILVALNKIDLPGANEPLVVQQLATFLELDQFGGDVFTVPISAIKRTGLAELLETLAFKVELLDLRADVGGRAQGQIIESRLSRGGGLVSVVVQKGTLKVGDYLVAGAVNGKIRGLSDDLGKKLKSAGPSTAVEIIGLKELPEAGDDLLVVDSALRARKMSARRNSRAKSIKAAEIINEKIALPKLSYYERRDLRSRKTESIVARMKEQQLSSSNSENDEGKGARSNKKRLDISYQSMDTKTGDSKSSSQRIQDVADIFNEVDDTRTTILLKAGNKGMLETVVSSFHRLQVDSGVEFDLLKAEVGALTQDDVLAAETFEALIFGMDMEAPNSVLAAAQKADVVIRSHKIIYHLIEDLENLMSDKLSEEDRTVVHSTAKVLETFDMRGQRVGGLMITKGMFKDRGTFRILRDGEVVKTNLKLESLRVKKDKVNEVGKGKEWGVVFASFSTLQPNDIVELFETTPSTSLFENRTKIVTAEDVKDK